MRPVRALQDPETQILDSLGSAIIATDLEGRVVEWNRGAEEIYGWTAEEALGRDVVELTPSPEARQRAGEIMAALSRGESWTGFFHLQRRDGSTFLGRVRNTPLVGPDGTLTGVVGMSEPVTAQEDDALRPWFDERRLSLALEASGMATWEWDLAGDRVVWDERFEAIAGVQPGTFEGTLGAWLALVHPEDRLLVLDPDGGQFEPGETFDLEFRLVRPDGEVRWIEARGTSLAAPGAHRVSSRAIGVAVDVTDRKEAEADRDDLLRRYADLANTLQESLLPPSLPLLPDVAIASAFVPGHDFQIGGDFYDVVVLDDGFGVFVGDVCGKGARAARLTALARYTMRAASHRSRDASSVLRTLNEALLRDAERRPPSRSAVDERYRFVTAAFAYARPVDGALGIELALGGHEQPLVVRAGGDVEVVGEPGSLLGIVDEPALTNVTFRLEAGDLLVLYTDGATDVGSGDDRLGLDGLVEALGALAGEKPDAVVDQLEDLVTSHQRSGRRDDVAIVAFGPS